MNTIIVRQLSLLVVLIAFTSCKQNVKDIEVTEDNFETVFEDIEDSKDLTVGEGRLLQAYMMRMAMLAAFQAAFSKEGGDISEENAGKVMWTMIDSTGEGKTIGDLIEDQIKWEAEQEIQAAEEEMRAADEKVRRDKAQAEEERQREQLRGVLSVTIYDKGFIEGDWKDYITIKISYDNTSDRDIRGFKGDMVFDDLFGDPIMRVSLKEDDVLKAGQSRRVSRTIDYNQFRDSDQRLKSTQLDNLSIRWEPETILFTDGESLSIDAPDQ